ncbi:class I SAM-dependent methyltransferase [Fodinicola feengrottensis]|uniref:class I SAM-dependent methyltransferase n=1 Tax=Fodinicola feengrottensis TaxID=435914 RepID=UPI002442F945|nr:class I SAM-dependent methyltransferase [Fodinicola feengrottensis]
MSGTRSCGGTGTNRRRRTTARWDSWNGIFRDTREWICRQATGDILEVAIGTGLNLPHYAEDVRLAAVEQSPEMLAIGQQRAEKLGMAVDLRIGDAQALNFPDASLDTVVCTFSLCAIPDDHRAVREMIRVLRPGGLLLLADHVAGAHWPTRAAQWSIERITIPLGEEHFRRRPIRHVQAGGLVIEHHERFNLGIIERLAARKPVH